MKKNQFPERVLMRNADDIEEQARRIRDVAQKVMDACQSEIAIDSYARSKVVGGNLAGDAATLGIMIVAYELERQRDDE